MTGVTEAASGRIAKRRRSNDPKPDDMPPHRGRRFGGEIGDI